MPINDEIFEEAQDCLKEALDLLLKLKELVIEAKPIVESEMEMELSIIRMNTLPENIHSEFSATETRSDKWLAKFKELFPNEA